MKKFLSKLFIIFTVIFSLTCSSVFAAIRSASDIDLAILKLQQIKNKDFISLINKSELIGNRLTQFNMISEQYKTSALAAADRLSSLKNQIATVSNSTDISQSDKDMQIKTLYNDADTILFDMDSKTVTYLYSLGSIMPSLTYQRYTKKYSSFYNGLRLSGQQITVQQ